MIRVDESYYKEEEGKPEQQRQLNLLSFFKFKQT